MPTYNVPDVYIDEVSVFPPSVAEVETAIPAFIGYTEIATLTTTGDLLHIPTKISSMQDYELYFGSPYGDPITLTVTQDPPGVFTESLFSVNGSPTPDANPKPTYFLYYAVRMFFDNGGGDCYIVSAGGYSAAISSADITTCLANLAFEDEPTMIVIPDAVSLDPPSYTTLANAVLLQCNTLQNRFAIFDIYEGSTIPLLTDWSASRSHFVATSPNFLSYGAAYYPFLISSLNHYIGDTDPVGANVTVTYINKNPGAGNQPTTTTALLNSMIATNTTVYNFVKAALQQHYVKIPPSGAVAGVYAATDNARGVWKAPANVGLIDVVQPLVKINNNAQGPMNVDSNTGVSINAIRAFTGKGTLVWGARTLDGNSNEWRYVSVRRFFIMVEQSVKYSTYWAVFEPNDANTWVKVRGMIENYLTQKWREGALAGSTPQEAFYVKCGLGTTMSSDDILNGLMNVEIGMAAVRPAEFIILKFSHMLQTS